MCYWKFAILNAISLQKMQLKYRQKTCFPHHELESHFVVRTGCQLLPLWQGAKGHYFFADLCGEHNYFLQKWYAVLFGNCFFLAILLQDGSRCLRSMILAQQEAGEGTLRK